MTASPSCRGTARRFAEVWAACERAGFRLTAVNWHLTGGEAAYVVDDSEAKAVVADSDSAGVAVEAAAARTTSSSASRPTGRSTGFDDYDAVLAAESTDDIDDPTPGTFMLYTSGTTGRPKGVFKPPAPPPSTTSRGYREGNAHLCTGPLYHAAPITISLVSPLRNGATVVLMDHWDPEETLRLIEEHRIIHTHMVPTMFHRLLALDDTTRARYDLSSLRLVVHGAAPCPVTVKQAMIEWLGPVVVEYYAATEGAGTLVDSGTWLRKPGTVGKPARRRVRVGDDAGRPLPAGEIGTVWLKATGNERFHYFHDDDKTDRAYSRRLLHPRRPRLPRRRRLPLPHRPRRQPRRVRRREPLPGRGRRRAARPSGGGRRGHHRRPQRGVGRGAEGAGRAEGRRGHVTALADELIEFCRGRLAHFKCPRSVDFVDRLPRDDNGKIYKRRLRDEYRGAATAASP